MRFPSIAVAIAVAAALVLPVAQPAHADTGCPTAAGAYASGTGTSGDPWVLSTGAHLQRLRDTSADWDNYFVLTSDIAMNGCTWSTPIGNYLGTRFTGSIDGNGHVISGLSVASTSQMDVGLIGSLVSPGSVTGLGFTGSVSYSARVMGGADVMAGGLVGYAGEGTTIARSFSSANITITATVDPDCDPNGCIQSGYVRAGGLVGDSRGSVQNSYATGSLQSATVTAGSGTASVIAGGLVGTYRLISGSSISNSYATGAVTGQASGTQSSVVSLGGFAGDSAKAMSTSFWDTTTSQIATAVGGGNQTGVTGKTEAQMKTFSTFSAWDIVNGFDAANVWGICPRVNSGRPFLSAFYSANPCTPVVASVTPNSGPLTGGTNITISGTNFSGATVLAIAGVNATPFTVNNAGTEITVTTPGGVAGAQDISIVTPDGTGYGIGVFTYELLPQTVWWSPTTSLLTTDSGVIPAAAETLGGAVISYAVTSTTNSCTADPSTAQLTFASTGTCTVRATAAPTTQYDIAYTDVTFTVSAPPPSSGGGSSGGASTGSSSATPSTPSAASTGTAPSAETIPEATGDQASTTSTRKQIAGARIYFGLGSSDLDARDRKKLKKLIRVTRSRATGPSTVAVGVVRAVGARAADRELALERARNVADYLRDHGMPGTVTVGSSVPTTETTAAARRVDVTVTPGGTR